jgi:hypothetical protein
MNSDLDRERAKERGFDLLAPIDEAFERADGWRPPMRFDFVRTGLEYVPPSRRRAYVDHLLEHVVVPGGRLIIGKNNEDRGRSAIADDLRSWGWSDVQEVRRPHAHPEVEISVVWIQRRRSAAGG